MPFLDKLTDKFGDLMKEKLGGRHDTDKEHESSHGSYEGHESQFDQRAYHENHPPYYEQQQSYGAPPQLPPGWIQQWDANSGRYYYVEQATGRTQWEPPMMYPAAGMHGASHEYGHESHGHDAYGGSHYDSHGEETYRGSSHGESEHKDSSHTGMALAGGALLGAAGGAWAMHEYNEHEEEEAAAAAVAAPQTMAAVPADDTIYVPAEAADSDVEEAADEVYSEREDVAEAQEELAEASSESDREEAREELEEEQEELEEANEDLEEEIED